MPNEARIHYRIIPANPQAHLFQISLRISQPDPQGQIVSMPAWIPGSYMIRDFAKNVVTLEARNKGKHLQAVKIDKDSWQLPACEGEISLEYQVYAWDLSVRTAHLDTSHGYFNGTSVFLRVHGQDDQPCTVEILPPAGDIARDWRVATTLPRDGAEDWGFGRYRAPDYEELVDHPVEMGNFSQARFEAGGIPHDIVISGRHRADMDRLSRDVKKICETHIDLYGELPDIDRYLFMLTVVGDGYGGLEHRASTSLLCSREDLPLAGEPDMSEGYRNLLGLCSHEYFHTWNVKRIKPAVFMPYDLNHESHTRQLWAFEGITAYYDDLALTRSGVIDAGSYLELLGQTITRVWRGAGRFKQSVAESSFDTWTKFYKQDESAPNNIVSYYTKGSLIALALDLTVRKLTCNRKSLDDLMRQLWQEYGKPGIGVPEGRIEEMASELAGQNLDVFFQQYLYGTQDPPLAALLKDLGIEFKLRPASNADDKGGKPAADDSKTVAQFGARIVKDNSGARLSHVFDNTPAQRAGLSAGDLVIALEGLKTDKASLEKTIARYSANSRIKLHVFRRDELHEFSVQLAPAPDDTCYLLIDDKAGDQAIGRRQQWLKGNEHEQSG